MQEKNLRHKLMIIISCIFVLPSFVLCYIFYEQNVTLSPTHFILFFLIIALAVIGIILVRYVFDAVSTTADFLKKATQGGEKLSLNLHQEAVELNEISSSLNRMIERFEKTTESLNQTKEKLHESEDKYLNILENIEEGYYELDLAGNVTSFNEACRRIYGYSREELMGRNALKIADEDNAKKAFKYFNKIYTTGKPLTRIDGEIIRKDGSRRNVEASASLIRDLAGQPIGFRGIIRDVTEHRQAEEALRDSEEKYRALAYSADAMYLVDRECRYQFMNDAHLLRLGVSLDQVKGRSYGDFHSEEDMKQFAAAIEAVFETGKSFQTEHYGRMNDSFFVRTLSPVKNSKGSITAVTVISKDITERKQAEENSQRESLFRQSIIDHAAEGICVCHDVSEFPYMRFTVWNQHMTNITGYTMEEINFQGWHQTVYPDPEIQAKASARMDLMRQGSNLHQEEWEITRKDGQRRQLLISTCIVSGGEIGVNVLAVMNDITDRKRVEEEKRRLEERLQRSEKMEALGTLAGGVAHDLNNVLGVLVGYSELLLQKVPQESPFQRHAMQIFKGGQRAAAIIQDLLTLTRRGVVVSEALNLNRIISDFLQMPEFEAIRSHHPGVQFKTSLDAELLNIKGSSTHLSKTVMNLLSNAAEAISGLGEVLIKTENLYVDRPIHGYDTTQEGEYAMLTVSDTGSGISPADLGRIFEPFYTKKVMGRSGTGLGLAVVWGTVKDHDGYIDVRSTEGEGSIFTLYFPVTREDLTKAEQVVPQSTYMGRGEHILVVDDVEGQRLLASAMLEGLGYKVNTVANGEEAIEFVKDKPVDLLILDMIMDPGIDGLETYRRILEIRKDQKAIIVSGFSETDRVITAQSLGAGAYVRKPYVIGKLGLAVRKELDRK